MIEELEQKGKQAVGVAFELSKLSSGEKNRALEMAADLLERREVFILDKNREDLHQAEQKGIKGALMDRLMLNTNRIRSMADGLRQIVALPDPIGEVLSMVKRPNGLLIGQRRVPMGVIGIIYEARPNVTADAFGLCLKTGNATILRGGKEAFHSNLAIVSVLQEALERVDLPKQAVQLVEDTRRDSALAMMKLNNYLDLLIPRGGAGLIQAVVQNSTVPVIETGVGNCHIYIDKYADMDKALAITVNAKTHRPGVCNAAESVLVHRDICDSFLPKLGKFFLEKQVEVRGDETVLSYIDYAKIATEEDWAKEYLDAIISIKVVNDIDAAISHINQYGSKHSEAIVSDNYTYVQQFLDQVDAAAVYANASTRFTDGMEFGFGAEIGISTQKLHARGPMGLKELTSTKYIIYGNGQIRV